MSAALGRLIHESGRWELDRDRRELRDAGVPVPIGTRAFEVLETLVQCAGELVTKDEIMRRVWPGAVVAENTLQVHVSAVRKALGSDRALLKTSSGRGYRLLGRWAYRNNDDSLEHAARPLPGPQAPVLGSGTSLVGRDHDVSRVRDLLTAYRLVTLTGPGGIGKTSLALEVLRSHPGPEGHQTAFVELAAVPAGQGITSSVAGALGVFHQGAESSDLAIADAIGSRSLLLILDNCEHVISAAASLADALVRRCPRTVLLTTSREALRIEGEYAYRVRPLELLPDNANGRSEEPLPSALRLFMLRAAAGNAGFAPTADNIRLVAAICRRLDGLPLAIEFAAARAATLGIDKVLSRLNGRFELLTASRRTPLPRHATLRATLDWSYELLSLADQKLLHRLSIFAATFTLEAASAVAVCETPTTPLIEDGIASLLSKSLLSLERRDSETCYRLPETIRAYAFEKLRLSDDLASTARRHAEFLRDIAPSGLGEPETIEAGRALDRYKGVLDDVRAAHQWAFSELGDPGIGAALTASYIPVWLHFSMMSVCRDMVDKALAQLGPGSALDPALRMRLYTALGVALIDTTGLLAKTHEVLGEALDIADTAADLPFRLRILWAKWADRSNNGDNRAAYGIATTLYRTARASGDRTGTIVGCRLLGNTLHYLGKHRRSATRLRTVVRSYSVPQAGQRDIWFHYDQPVLARAMLARVSLLRGFPEQALRESRACLDDARANGHKLSLCYALGESACPIALLVGDAPLTSRLLEEFRDLAEGHGFLLWMSLGQCLAGALQISAGDAAAGVTVLRDALDLLRRTGRAVMHYSHFLGLLADGLSQLGRHQEASAAIEQALARSWRGEPWCLPELLRLKGKTLLRGRGDLKADRAEECFKEAILIARSHGALFWELRASTDLAAQLLRGTRQEAVEPLLAPVCARFAEGLALPDLLSAQALLDQIGTRTGA